MTFVDTSFWVALMRRREARHDEARTLWAQTAASAVTTNHVMGETWTVLQRRDGRHIALSFLTEAQRSARLLVVHIDEDVERESWSWLRRRDERVYSFVDATSFAVMRRRRIKEALAFDGDFTAAGFVELRT